MMVLIIGKNRAEFGKIKKKDVSKPFFVTRNQLYKVYPDGLIPIDIYHDGAFIRSESITAFEENGTVPCHTGYPEQYEDDVILMNIDEHKIMKGKRAGLFSTIDSKEFRNSLPWIVGALALAYGFLSQWGII